MNRSYSKLRHIQESNILLEKRLAKEKLDESYWDRLFGRPTIKDSAGDALKSKGFSHTSRDEDEEHIIFDNQKFYSDDIEYAGPHDMGEIPRIEGDKLIIANPAWKL